MSRFNLVLVVGVILAVLGVFVYASLSDNTPNKATGSFVGSQKVIVKVDIPCPGHSSLIVDALRGLDGIVDVRFRVPDLFDVSFDSSKTSEQEIIGLDVFKTYKASVVG